jgi:hypothetical protein
MDSRPWYVALRPEDKLSSASGDMIAAGIATEPNARLIAAAPEMYEALDHNMQTVHRAHHASDSWNDCAVETCQRARGALAKADGR